MSKPKTEIRWAVYPSGGDHDRENLIGYIRHLPSGRWICGEQVEQLPDCRGLISACRGWKGEESLTISKFDIVKVLL